MRQRRTHLRHGNKEVEIRLTGDISAEFPVFISHADQNHIHTINFASVIDPLDARGLKAPLTTAAMQKTSRSMALMNRELSVVSRGSRAL